MIDSRLTGPAHKYERNGSRRLLWHSSQMAATASADTVSEWMVEQRSKRLTCVARSPCATMRSILDPGIRPSTPCAPAVNRLMPSQLWTVAANIALAGRLRR
eukprot:scaffold175407_cov30-Tisochrysis_lutea.AAC.1